MKENSARSRPNKESGTVLVFHRSERPTAEALGQGAMREFKVKLDELLGWFKGFKVDTIELWIEGAGKSGKLTELFLSLEGRGGVKVTLKPPSRPVS